MGQTFHRFHCVAQTNHHVQGTELLLTAHAALCSSWMHEYLIGTVLSLISAHRRSQLKHQKLRVGNYICMDEVLEWFNYSRASAHPGCKVIVRMYQIDHHLVRASSRPGRWWRKLYRARKQTDLQPCCVCRLQYVNFVLQAKNAANKATDRYVRNLDVRCCDA